LVLFLRSLNLIQSQRPYQWLTIQNMVWHAIATQKILAALFE